MAETELVTGAHLDMLAASRAWEDAETNLAEAIRDAFPLGAEVRWYVLRKGVKHEQVGRVDGYRESLPSRGSDLDLRVYNFWSRKTVFVPRHRLIEWIEQAIYDEASDAVRAALVKADK